MYDGRHEYVDDWPTLWIGERIQNVYVSFSSNWLKHHRAAIESRAVYRQTSGRTAHAMNVEHYSNNALCNDLRCPSLM